MAILRVLTSAMVSLGTFRSYQFVLLLAAALAVVAFYYIGSERHNFSSNTKRIRQSQASLNANRNDADVSQDTGPAGGGDSGPLAVEYHTLIMFTKVDKSRTLQEKFQVTMKSMAKHGRFLEGEVLVLHFVSDEASREIGKRMVPELFIDATFLYQVVFHDIGSLTEKLFPIVEVMQKHFSAGSGAYFSDAIFFLSVAMHRVMPPELKRIVQLDLDLQFRSNIRDLFQEFSRFPAGAVIGIGPELQPVYRHMFWQYRRENPKTRVGNPPPDGRPGFNSGVMLLDLEAMRGSVLYNQLLQPGRVTELAQQYKLQGHLGDQDFFTLVGMEYPGLFSPLACTWNRQLCTWWREHGYGEVFELYHRCEGPVHIYHGNCNTPIPDD